MLWGAMKGKEFEVGTGSVYSRRLAGKGTGREKSEG